MDTLVKEELYEVESEHEFSDMDEEDLSTSLESDSSSGEILATGIFHYEVLSTEQIEQLMADYIREVNTVVQIPPTITRILLNHFKWNKEKLYEKYYDDDQHAIFKEAHIIDPYLNGSDSSEDSKFACDREKCEICLTTIPRRKMFSVSCSHCFCTECWKKYLTFQITGQGMCQMIACPAYGCNIIVDDQKVVSLITDPEVKSKYKHLITNSFVECNRLLKWCPQSGCDYAISVQYVDARPVTCRRGHTFCFACGENCHEPLKCNMLKKWQKKCNDDSETSNWIAANTKECPSCNVKIEKNGGCNHMTCTNKNCNSHFCWFCLVPLKNHHLTTQHSCNRYSESETESASRAALKRYLFYNGRYMNHMLSIQIEQKLYASAKEKMEEMEQQRMPWCERKFLKNAVDALCQCRKTLMYTYVFAYYVKENNQSVIFEHNQHVLESATESLSECLEREVLSKNVDEVRVKIQDKNFYCESMRKALINHVHDGYENGWWEFID